MDGFRVTKAGSEWALPIALLALSAIPLIASVRRMLEISGGAAVTAENARFFAAPVPIVLHVVASNVFSILGAFQFVASFRRHYPAWHRRAGRVLAACGLIAGLSGLWMTQFYPRAEGDGTLLYVFRMVVGVAMVACMVLGYFAARRRDFMRHRAWMTRGYALGIGAGTQVVVHIPWLLVAGQPDELVRALLLGAGWAINVAIAEWALRRRPARRVAMKAVEPATR
jgi:uncharacterized membrane protein